MRRNGRTPTRSSWDVARAVAREIELLATRGGGVIALEDDEIIAAGERIAQLMVSTAPIRGFVNAQELAAELGVARDWVYANAQRLGAIRLGDGPKARLRFDVAQARRALMSGDDGGRSPDIEIPRPKRRRSPRRTAPTGIRLIQGRSSQ